MGRAAPNPSPMSSPADQPASDPGRSSAVAVHVEQLYASHAALVRSVCRSLLRDPSEADDAVQQTFLSAQRALLNGSSPRDAAAWLATIARHESLARVRARMREPLPVAIEEHEAAAPDAHVAAVHRHETGELRDALADLPAQQREAILLREMRGLSYQEVASSLAVTTSAVESLLFRARRSLKMRLQEALAAVTPVESIRELAARLAGGGLAGPAAAKIAAVGLGTAVATGGALVGPTVIGLGHAPTPRVSSPPASRHRPTAHAASNATVWATAPPHPTRVMAVFHAQTGGRHDRGDSGSRTEISDRQPSSDTREHEPSSDTASSTSGDRSTHETADRGTTSDGTSDSRDSGSGDGSTDSTSTDSTSNTTTTDSGSTDSTSNATTTTDSASGG
jgi:RNA polymerase sigma factor (sigma-70 family)